MHKPNETSLSGLLDMAEGREEARERERGFHLFERGMSEKLGTYTVRQKDFP